MQLISLPECVSFDVPSFELFFLSHSLHALCLWQQLHDVAPSVVILVFIIEISARIRPFLSWCMQRQIKKTLSGLEKVNRFASLTNHFE